MEHASSCQQDERSAGAIIGPLVGLGDNATRGLTTSVIEPQRGVERLRLLRGPLTKIRSPLQCDFARKGVD